VHWTEEQFRFAFAGIQAVNGRSKLKGKLKSEMSLTGGWFNHWAYLNPGGLVVVTVYGPSKNPWGYSPIQEECYGFNPDGTTYPWYNTERRLV